MSDLDEMEVVLQVKVDIANARLCEIADAEARHRTMLRQLADNEKSAANEAAQTRGYCETGRVLLWTRWVQERRNQLNTALASILAKKLAEMRNSSEEFGRLEALRQVSRAEQLRHQAQYDLAQSEELLHLSIVKRGRDQLS